MANDIYPWGAGAPEESGEPPAGAAPTGTAPTGATGGAIETGEVGPTFLTIRPTMPTAYAEPYAPPPTTVPTAPTGLVITAGTVLFTTASTATFQVTVADGRLFGGTLTSPHITGGLLPVGTTVFITGGSIRLTSPTSGTVILITGTGVRITGAFVTTGAAAPTGAGLPSPILPFFPAVPPGGLVGPAPTVTGLPGVTPILPFFPAGGGGVLLNPNNPGLVGVAAGAAQTFIDANNPGVVFAVQDAKGGGLRAVEAGTVKVTVNTPPTKRDTYPAGQKPPGFSKDHDGRTISETKTEVKVGGETTKGGKPGDRVESGSPSVAQVTITLTSTIILPRGVDDPLLTSHENGHDVIAHLIITSLADRIAQHKAKMLFALTFTGRGDSEQAASDAWKANAKPFADAVASAVDKELQQLVAEVRAVYDLLTSDGTEGNQLLIAWQLAWIMIDSMGG